MKWASAISKEDQLEKAVIEAVHSIKADLQSEEPDLLFVFVSSQHRLDYEKIPALLNNEFPSALVMGCSSDGVIESQNDAEEIPALSLMAGVLPGVEIAPFYLENDMLPVASTFSSIEDIIHVSAEEENHFILFTDPFSFDIENFLSLIDRHMLKGNKFGSMAGGGEKAGENALFMGGKTFRSGLVGVSLSGNIKTKTLSFQGYKPLGAPLFITKHQENIIHEFDNQANSDILNELYDNLDQNSQEEFRDNLLIGLLQPAVQQSAAQNQFLLRNILGLEPKSKGIIVGAPLEPNMVAQFFIKDKNSCQNNIKETLKNLEENLKNIKGVMALSCLDRGAELYHESLYEVHELQKSIGKTPLAGMFGSGEIGPLGNKTVLHGYSSLFALFSEKET